MANSGANSNRSQLYDLTYNNNNSFITFSECKHLDKKHTIFGKIVGGMSTLDLLETIETGKEDRPNKDIIIMDSQVFVNPFRDSIQEILAKEHKKKLKKIEEDKVDVNERWFVQKATPSTPGQVGKYLKTNNPSLNKQS